MYPGFVFAKKCVKMYPYQLCIIGGKPYLGEMRFLLSREEEEGENINQILGNFTPSWPTPPPMKNIKREQNKN